MSHDKSIFPILSLSKDPHLTLFWFIVEVFCTYLELYSFISFVKKINMCIIYLISCQTQVTNSNQLADFILQHSSKHCLFTQQIFWYFIVTYCKSYFCMHSPFWLTSCGIYFYPWVPIILAFKLYGYCSDWKLCDWRRRNVRRCEWTPSTRRTPRWPTPSGSLRCRRLPLTWRSTLG